MLLIRLPYHWSLNAWIGQSTGAAKYSEKSLAAIAQNIVNNMPTDPDFPNPTPSISSVDKSLKAFEDALEKCFEGTKQDTAYKNEKRKELILKLSNLGDYVNTVSNGNLVKIDGSGFPLTKLPEPVGILPHPDYIHISDSDNHGELAVEISNVPKASGYLVLYSEVPAPANFKEWHSTIFSKSTGVLVDLKSATKYAFVAATMSPEANRLNHYNYTEPVERITQ